MTASTPDAPMDAERAGPARRFIIVGAGLAGCLLALALGRRGHRVEVFERRPDPRATRGYAGGRSINLALSARGLRGLAGVGLDTHVLRNDALPMPGRILHPAATAGAPLFQPYSANRDDAIHAVSRSRLNLTLLEAAAAEPRVRFRFGHACLDIDPEAPAAVFQPPDGAPTREQADAILGCDGAFSPVRARLQKTDRFEYSQSFLAHGYKELHIPPLAPGAAGPHAPWAMDPRGLHIWPRGGAMMIALPNLDGSFTCTLFWPFTGEHGFDRLDGPDAVRRFFDEHYPDAVGLMPTLTEDFGRNPAGSLVTIRCWPWAYRGRVCILGDASHAIVPFYGQGMNAAFEDCLALVRSLDRHRDLDPAFDAFQRERKPNADAIADMALENFLEMRDLAGRPEFQLLKRIEQTLHRRLGDPATPQYNLVSFSTVPYVAARRRGLEMNALLADLARRVPTPASGPDEAWEEALFREARPLVERLTPVDAPLPPFDPDAR